MAKKKLGGLGKGLDSLFAELPDISDEPARPCRCGKSSRTPNSPANALTRMR